MVIAVAHSPHTERHLSPLSPGDAALQQLRQSLARSPSRGPMFRLTTSRNSSPLQSPRSNQPDTFSDAPTTLFPVSAKKRKPVLRHMSPMRVQRSSLSVQRVPQRRILQDSSDNGNSGLQSMTLATAAPTAPLAPSPDEMRTSPDENMLAPHHAFGKKERSGYFDLQKSSPLKRSEANFDSSLNASPSAKRRSLHGPNLNQDFSILEQQENVLEKSHDMPPPPPQYSPLPRRRQPIRQTNLASRFDTVPAVRSRPTIGNIWDIQAAKARNRLSLDFPIPDDNNDSPFSFDITSQQPKELPTLGKLTLPPRHPLSRTITQSSDSSDIAEDSPTHPPIRHLGEFRRPFLEFTRSLPLGVSRPRDDSQDSSEGFATPANYKLAKPHPAAFMSTGLISKRNKNLTHEQLDTDGGIGDMPDTPCKRPFIVPGAPVPAPTPNVNLFKAKASRQMSHAFGTPSTPFNPQNSTTTPAGIPPTVFGNSFGQIVSRRSSLAEHIEEAPKASLLTFHDRSRIFETSPTPTKQASTNEKPFIFDNTGSDHANDDDLAIMDSKSISIPEITQARLGGMDESCLSSSARKLRFKDLDSVPSFSRRDVRGKMHCPSPLSKLFQPPSSTNHTKHLIVADPLIDSLTRTTADYVVPPDPSSLSISGHKEKTTSFIRRPSFQDSLSLNLPATPTAARDSLGKFSSFGVSVTPSNHPAPFNVDPSITSRFDKVEPLSTGEFSQVWRAYRFDKSVVLPKDGPRRSSFKEIPASSSVFAVKKAKNAYIGPKDRMRKLQEVETLKALGKAEHTIQYFDHWEYQEHLYIQTEYCEEGTLHSFLLRAGQSARLDDFRIWKIMLEMSKGLKHIHDSGFIHLDIKPANVLVSFEGVLKIGDFGMSSIWPAPPNIEGEGDREYIGPEILEGRFDKPADVFAFGLMMLEIAGNVMLPDNGTAWQRLRSGDMSDVPSLTSSSDITSISRDSIGNPITPSRGLGVASQADSALAAFDFGFETKLPSPGKGHRLGELRTPPEFMVNAEQSSALDSIVRWMISPEPIDRPTVDDLLATEGVRWVEARRRAGATIYEGNFGPADEVLNHDHEMIDV